MSSRARHARTALLSILAACAALITGDAPAYAADPVRLGPNDVPSTFHVAKSQNRNQVHYALLLDDKCAARGASPVLPYWRMLEKGPKVTEQLLSIEQNAYGIDTQTVQPDGKVAIVLKAVPKKTIVIAPAKNGRSCTATTTTTIAGTHARLERVYAKIKWPFGVDYLLLEGRAVDTKRPVKETLKP